MSSGTILTDNSGGLGRTQADMEIGWTEGFLRSRYSREVYFTVRVIAATGTAAPEQSRCIFQLGSQSDIKLETELGSSGNPFSSKCSQVAEQFFQSMHII